MDIKIKKYTFTFDDFLEMQYPSEWYRPIEEIYKELEQNGIKIIKIT